jgi:hypothetical protein
MTDPIDDVTHLAPATIAEHLESLGAESIIGFDDILTQGPCYLDSDKHREQRLQHWETILTGIFDDEEDIEGYLSVFREGTLTVEQLVSKIQSASNDRRFVVWTTPTWEDRLFCWLAFYALDDAGIEPKRIATAEPRLARATDRQGYVPLKFLEPVELQAGFDDIFYPESIYIEAGARLWKTFVTTSPRQFAITIGHTLKFFPELESFADQYGAVFPNQLSETAERFELSQFDRALFKNFDVSDWRTCNEALTGDFITDYEHLTEMFIVSRIVQWGDEKSLPEPAFRVRTRDSDSRDPYQRLEFRLTEIGNTFLNQGLESGNQAPMLWIGGSRSYTSTKPWVRVVEDDNWWFERFDPEVD